MICTDEMIPLLNKTDELITVILNSQTTKDYFNCYNKLKADETAQKEIKHFNNKKSEYEAIREYGSHYPNYQSATKAVFKAKRVMDTNENVANFKKAETDLQKLLDDITVILTRTVSDKIKVTTDSYFYSEQGDNHCSCNYSCHCK